MSLQEKKLLINSLPKSGTHLLAKVAELCAYKEHFSDQRSNKAQDVPLFFNYREVTNALAKLDEPTQPIEAILVGSITPVVANTEAFRYWLSTLSTHEYILGHVAWSKNLSVLLDELNYRHLFIIRDPRAVIASLLSFILDTKGMPKPHFLQADFKVMTQQEQLDLLLKGGHAPLADVQVKPFHDVYLNMLSWKDDPNCLFTRFEDLIGPQGGGTQEQQRSAVSNIVKHLGQTFEGTIAAEFENIYTTNARTFRKGSIDSWKQSFDDKALSQINDYCRPLCKAAGYL